MHHRRKKAQQKVGWVTTQHEMTARQRARGFSVVKARQTVVKGSEQSMKLYRTR
jgi:hypothetical protein